MRLSQLGLGSPDLVTLEFVKLFIEHVGQVRVERTLLSCLNGSRVIFGLFANALNVKAFNTSFRSFCMTDNVELKLLLTRRGGH